MNPSDLLLSVVALCLWREARGGGQAEMTAVACVIRNRVHRRNSGFWAEVFRPLAFSSMTAPHDPQLEKFPVAHDTFWSAALLIAEGVMKGAVADTTRGSTLYYDDSISFPHDWNRAAVVPQGKIGRLNLFTEK